MPLPALRGLQPLLARADLRRLRRVPENGWTTQKVFHLLNAFVCILRCVVFALRDKASPAACGSSCCTRIFCHTGACLGRC